MLGNRVDDGQWHYLSLTRKGGEGSYSLDNENHQFNIPGQPKLLKEILHLIISFSYR